MVAKRPVRIGGVMELEVGRYVLFRDRYGQHLECITRITPTLIRCEYHSIDKATFKVKCQDVWNPVSAKLLTDEEVARFKVDAEYAKKALKLKNFDYSVLTHEQIDQIYSIITPRSK